MTASFWSTLHLLRLRSHYFPPRLAHPASSLPHRPLPFCGFFLWDVGRPCLWGDGALPTSPSLLLFTLCVHVTFFIRGFRRTPPVSPAFCHFSRFAGLSSPPGWVERPARYRPCLTRHRCFLRSLAAFTSLSPLRLRNCYAVQVARKKLFSPCYLVSSLVSASSLPLATLAPGFAAHPTYLSTQALYCFSPTAAVSSEVPIFSSRSATPGCFRFSPLFPPLCLTSPYLSSRFSSL